MISPKVTKHAELRIRKHTGLPKKTVDRNAKLAFENGVCHSECTGRLKKYVDWLFLSHCIGFNIRLYCNYVYIFGGEGELITVLPFPNIYKNAVNKISQRKNENDD